MTQLCQAIRAVAASGLLCFTVVPAIAQGQQPLTLVREIALPGVEGDFDHFAYDLKRNRLISAAEEHHTLELFDLKTGAHLQSVSGFRAPHSIAYVPETDEIFVTDGDDSSCIILSAKDLHRVDRIALRAGPDSALYDSQSKRYYIANGGRDEKLKTSAISVIAVLDHKKLLDIPINGDNVEAMAVDHGGNRLFANVRDQKEVVAIDLASNRVVATWTGGMNRNTPMKFDAASQRLFVAGRTPGKLYIFDTTSGRQVGALDCVDSADDLTWDASAHRIYVTGAKGITVFQQKNPNTYTKIAGMKTRGGKTSIYVPELRQFYVAHPKGATASASVLIYRVNP